VRLDQALVGRSHRSREGRERLAHVITETKRILEIPPSYRVAITPASDTGAFEMAMWSMFGARGLDVLVWEAFGRVWLTDVLSHLKVPGTRVLEAPYGELPDVSQVNWANDVIFTANGTTSGVRVPNFDWIPRNRECLTFVDATSAVFAQPIDWDKADCLTFSWQKALGGEAAHGMLVLSPRAIERLETYTPPWPLPKLFRLTANGRVDEAIFEGQTINTPSMLCVEDYAQALAWAISAGGLAGLQARASANADVLHDWIGRTAWVENLARDPATWSNTSVCLKIVDPAVVSLSAAAQLDFVLAMCALLEREGVAYDIKSYRDAPPGLRVWTGPTVETADVKALGPWLDWAFAETFRARFPSPT
jgi:phosphoserine aminotransferase